MLLCILIYNVLRIVMCWVRVCVHYIVDIFIIIIVNIYCKLGYQDSIGTDDGTHAHHHRKSCAGIFPQIPQAHLRHPQIISIIYILVCKKELPYMEISVLIQF